MVPTCQPRTTCRLCEGTSLTAALTLPPTPPANAFVPAPTPQAVFPLQVRVCAACGHAQLSHVVDASSLFKDYVYVSGTSAVFRKHFSDYADAVRTRVGLRAGDLVCEIGSNDGTLLRCFPEARLVGIEPAAGIAANANAAGIHTINAFFSCEIADRIVAEHGRARLVLANNVMAHIDDLGGVLDGVRSLLADDGLFVMEVQYVGDMIRDGLFDMIYFEHVDYHALTPLIPFFGRRGLTIVDVERVPTHGGSIRVSAAPSSSDRRPSPSVAALVAEEDAAGLLTLAPWTQLQSAIETRGAELRAVLAGLRAKGLRIAGYGAPAKLTTLLYTFGIGAETLEYVVDDSPLKVGLYSPGLHLPIKASSALYEPATRPDAILICAWNFAPSIRAAHAALAGVTWITPLPDLQVNA